MTITGKRCFHGILLSALLINLQLHAQQLNFKTFTYKDGLSTYNISNTLQDRYGFVWIATQDGLFRYNGSGFQIFKRNNNSNSSTMGNVFLHVSFDGHDAVYASDYMNGFDLINIANLKIKKVGPDSLQRMGLPDYWIWDILFDLNENIWIRGVNYFAWKKKDDKKFKIVRKLEGIDHEFTPTLIRQIEQQYVAVGIPNYGTLIYDSRTFEKKGLIRNFSTESNLTEEIKDITLKNDTAYLATSSGILVGQFKNGQWTFFKKIKIPAFTNNVITSILCDRNQTLWAGTNNGLIRVKLLNGSYEHIQVIPGKTRWLADNTIRHLMLDNQDNLWISTSSVLQMVNTKSNGFTAFDGTGTGSDPIDHIYTLSTKNNDEIFATGTNGLYEVNIKTGFSRKIPGTENLGYIHHIEKINGDYWMLSSDMGMYLYQAQTNHLSQKILVEIYPEWEPYYKLYFNTAFRRGNTLIWASEEMEGLILWNQDTRTIKQYKAGTQSSHGLPENHIRNLKVDMDGHLWAMSDETAACIDLDRDTVIQVLKFQNGQFNSSILFDMHDDGQTLWFATYGGGINGFRKKEKTWTYITENTGLTNNSVYGILPEGDSVIWSTTNLGISRTNTKTLKSTNYYYEDGLQDNCFDEKGVLRKNNKLFFGGIKGFTMLDLTEFNSREDQFPAYVHMLEYYHKNKKHVINNLEWETISLPPGAGPVNLYLSALLFSGRNNAGFSYKIPGLIDDYINVPENNIISLTGLSHGKYSIQIRFRKRNGSIADKQIELTIFLKPRWYQTIWFRFLIALLLAVTAYALYRNRINQLRKEEKIRIQLASDLHDDLGSTLNSIKVHSNLALMDKENPNHLLLIKQGTQDAISGVRDIIWVLDDKKDQLGDILARISQFAEPLCAAQRIEYRAIMEDETASVKFGKEEKRNIYMILKESINNSLKYSDCSQITISAGKQDKKLRLEISDNGKGFAIDKAGNGYGLNNIRNRAKTVGYQASILSEPGKGTRVILEKN